MSLKIRVIGENRTIKRTLALSLVLKQVYEWELYMVSVRPRPVADFRSLPPVIPPPVSQTKYQHHIEPKIQRFTIDNSEWLRFLGGYEGQGGEN